MGDVMVGMTISLDGFVEDAAGSVGRGPRLFEHLEDLDLTLERLQVTALPGGRTHLRFRIVK